MSSAIILGTQSNKMDIIELAQRIYKCFLQMLNLMTGAHYYLTVMLFP
jgi:hypothetical protein